MIEFALRHDFRPGTLDIAFTASTPGITVLFGPSGAGKSSVIAALCGLFRPHHCRVAIDDVVLCDTASRLWTPPERRRLGVVFQDARLFPHLAVRGNLEYGLRRSGPGPIDFDRVVDLLGLARLLHRRPHTLSGGERQRVGIGRAVLSQPRLLLMDEPMANLDATRRADILPFVARLARDLAIPIVYVTHRMGELAALADTVVLLQAGRVLAADTLARLSARADLDLSTLDEAGAVLHARVLGEDEARCLTMVQAGAARLLISPASAAAGSALRLRIPATDVILARAAPGIAVSAQNLLPCRVRAVQHRPAQHAAMLELDLGDGAALLARITPDAVMRLELAPGTQVLALIKASAVEVLGR